MVKLTVRNKNTKVFLLKILLLIKQQLFSRMSENWTTRRQEGANVPSRELPSINRNSPLPSRSDPNATPQNILNQQNMMRNLLAGSNVSDRAWSYTHQSPVDVDAVEPASARSLSRFSGRNVVKTPSRTLDAEDINADPLLNVMQWSRNYDIIAIALDNILYLFDVKTNGDIDEFVKIPNSTFTCVRWFNEGPYLALASMGSVGRVDIYDIKLRRHIKSLRTYENQRAVAMDMYNNLFAVGSSSGPILLHNLVNNKEDILRGHTQEVCDIKWQSNGRAFISGGMDGHIFVWNDRGDKKFDIRVGLPVMCLSFCPWEPSIFVSGGEGSNVIIWSSSTGLCKDRVEAQFPVTAIMWNENYKELLTFHNGPQYDMRLWKWQGLSLHSPILECSDSDNDQVEHYIIHIETIYGHLGTILCASASPKNNVVASLSADKNLRLWDLWPKLKSTRKHGSMKLFLGGHGGIR